MSDDSTALFGRALELHKAGNLAEAIPIYREALERGPEFADLTMAAGIAFYMNQQFGEAEKMLRRATELAPTNALAHNHLGTVLNEMGRPRDAIIAFERAIELAPDDAISLTNLGCSYRSLARFEEARDVFLRAAKLNPTIPEIHSNLGTMLATLDQPTEAGLRLYVALVLNPGYADAYSNMGGILLRGALPHTDPAMQVLRRAVQINPDLPTAHSNLSVILAGRGEPDIAVPHNLRAAELAPSPEHWSRVLFNLNYCDSWSTEACANEHKRIGALFDAAASPLRLPPPGQRRAGRHRVGFVSPDFRNHSVSYFLRPLLAAFDRLKFETFCYSDVLKEDEVSAEIRASSDHWVPAVGLSDVELAHKIRTDEIDTLIDLAGHTPNNRMGTFAMRPAPVQITWLGYANTSGLSTIDYRIVDAVTDPSGTADELASETLLRLPDGFLCYGPPPYAPQPAARPPAKDGAVIFGTFNNPTKITDATFDLWFRLLTQLPKAKLLIKSFRLRDEVLRDHILRKFTDRGLAPDRLILLDADADAVEHLASYGQIDIGLDPVLYNGTTTTCEAMWMGVPVVAMAGDRHAARVGASLLTLCGLTELIAENPDDYIKIAMSLARDPARLAALRAGLRERMAASPLCDQKAFARKFERALLDAAPRRAAAPAAASLPEILGELGELLKRDDERPNEVTLLLLRHARNRLVDSLLSMPLVPDSSFSLLASISHDLAQAGLKTGLSSSDEIGLLTNVRAALSASGEPLAAAVMAHCLMTAPHALPALPALEDIPDRWLKTLVSALYEEPIFWASAEEPTRHLRFAEALTAACCALLERRAKDPAIGEITLALFTSTRFMSLCFADQPLTAISRDRSRLADIWLANWGAQLDHSFAPVKRPKIRLGCLRASWEESAESAALLAHLRAIDDRFEIILYGIQPLGDTPFERQIAAIAGRYRLVPDNIPFCAKTIREDDLDILLVGQNGTALPNLPMALAAYRMARFQVATTANPSTTGSARIDAFLNGEFNERKGAQSDYTERLLLVPGSINHYEFHNPPEAAPPSATRAELGFAEDSFVFASSASIHKITAELIESWAQILKRRDNSMLMLYPFNPDWRGLHPFVEFDRHLRKVLSLAGADPSRLRLLPQQLTRTHIQTLLRAADLYLDSFPFSDTVSLLDPLEAELPMLLFEGSQARCRQSAGMHAEFRLPALLAKTPEEYIQKALELSRDERGLARLRAEAGPCKERMKAGRMKLADTLFDAFRRHAGSPSAKA